MKTTSRKSVAKSKPTPSVKLAPKEGYTALHPGFRHKVWYGFRDGASTLRLRRKYSLTQSVVEQIIRDHLIGKSQTPTI
jgi:hypothetical protein